MRPVRATIKNNKQLELPLQGAELIITSYPGDALGCGEVATLGRAANNKDENIRDDNKDKKPTIIPNASRTNDITEIGTQKQLNKEENE